MSPDAITGELQLVNIYRAHLAAVTSALSPRRRSANPGASARRSLPWRRSDTSCAPPLTTAVANTQNSRPLCVGHAALLLSAEWGCAPCFRTAAHICPVPTTGPDCAETAHLANDCFRDLDGLRAADSYGDDAGASRPAEHVLAARSLSSTPPAYETGDPILARLAKPTPLSSTESLRRPLAWRRRHSDSAWSLFPSVHRGTSQGLRTPLLLARRLHHAAGSRCGQPGS